LPFGVILGLELPKEEWVPNSSGRERLKLRGEQIVVVWDRRMLEMSHLNATAADLEDFCCLGLFFGLECPKEKQRSGQKPNDRILVLGRYSELCIYRTKARGLKSWWVMAEASGFLSFGVVLGTKLPEEKRGSNQKTKRETGL